MNPAPVRSRDRVELALWMALVMAWFAIMMRFGHGDVYATLGPFACLVVALVSGLRREQLAAWFAPRSRAIVIGLGVGALMTALTYPLFRIAQALVPSLNASVEMLYANARNTSLVSALVWIIVVIAAEELLFRGALPATLSRWLPERSAFLVSLGLYALAQFGTGSWIVTGLAFGCGTIWTAQRRITDSVLSPLLAHLIWTPIVLLLHPVT